MIQSSGGLSDKEIEAMVKDAERNQAADAKRKEAVEARNELDRSEHILSYIHTYIHHMNIETNFYGYKSSRVLNSDAFIHTYTIHTDLQE